MGQILIDQFFITFDKKERVWAVFLYNFFIIDLRLPLLAAINLHLSAAEEAILEGQTDLALIEMEKADIAIDELKGSWPEVENPGLLSAMADPLFLKSEEIKKKLPKNTASKLKKDDPDLIEAKAEEEMLEKEAKNQEI